MKINTAPENPEKKGLLNSIVDDVKDDFATNMRDSVIKPLIGDILITISQRILGGTSNVLTSIISKHVQSLKSPTKIAQLKSNQTSYNKMAVVPASNQPVTNFMASTNPIADLYFESSQDANRVLEALQDEVEESGRVSAYDLYFKAGRNPPFTYNHYGWMNLRDATIVMENNLWRLKMPKAVYLP